MNKKRNDKTIVISLLIFNEKIISQYFNRYFSSGDNVQINFYINAKPYQDKFYNNLFVEKLVVIKKGKSNSMNMFDQRNSDF